MPLRDEHKKYKDWLVNDLYRNLRAEQGVEDKFYRDTYDVPQLGAKSIISIQYAGKAARLIDAPAENIITSNPQVSRIPVKATKGAEEANIKVMSVLNGIWVPYIKRFNPNLFKESVRKVLLRGDVWGRIWHNEDYHKKGMPVIFGIPDPMTIFCDPTEEVDGIPQRVMVYYMRNPEAIKEKYPTWSNPKNAGGAKKEGKATSEWCEVWTPDERVFYADDEEVLATPNPYGFVPFVHKLSGFGTTAPDGALEKLIVGRLRNSKSIIQRWTGLVSALDWVIYTFANRSFDAKVTDQNAVVPEDFEEQYQIGLGQMHRIPYGVEVTAAIQDLPEAPVFAYLNSIDKELELDDPLVMQGIPQGQSGRQQDMTQLSALRRYDTVIENIEVLWGQLFGMALQICEKLPGFLPPEFSKDDIGGNYDVSVKLKAADPLEEDRKAMLGSRLLAQGEIDPITNLVEFKGYTEERARQILVDRLKWKVLLEDPQIAQVIGYRAVEHAGMADDLELVRARAAMAEQAAKGQPAAQPSQMGQPGQALAPYGGGLGGIPTPTAQQRASGAVQPGTGMEMLDMALSQRASRKPPVNYQRGDQNANKQPL